MHSYLQAITDFINHLDPASQQALDRITTRKTFQKGDFLLRQDEICRYSFWIEDGMARKFYRTTDREITTEFYFANDLAISFQSYTLQQPGREVIQALDKTTVTLTDYYAFRALKDRHPNLIALDLMLTEYYAIWLEERLFQFHTLDATSRYRHLLSSQPHFIQHIKLTYLASYLGVSLETLSRIRAKI